MDTCIGQTIECCSVWPLFIDTDSAIESGTGIFNKLEFIAMGIGGQIIQIT